MVVPPMPVKAYSTIASIDINSTFLGMTHPGSHLQVISANRADLDCTIMDDRGPAKAETFHASDDPVVQDKGSGNAIKTWTLARLVAPHSHHTR